MTPSALACGGLVLDIAGALTLAQGLMFKKPDAALDEATPRYDFNAAFDVSLFSQTADAQVGSALLTSGFLVQMFSSLGWHESSWFDTGLAVGSAVATSLITWLFLVRIWRPRKIKQGLFYRLRVLDLGVWLPALAAYGTLLRIDPLRDGETVAAFARRLLGPRRWQALTAGIDPSLLTIYTKPRSEIAGTTEYAATHERDLDAPLDLRHPPDRTLLREESAMSIYITYRSVLYGFPSPEALREAGFDLGQETVVVDAALVHLPRIPPEETLLQEQKTGDLFIVLRGVRFQLSETQLADLGRSRDEVIGVPWGVLGGIPHGGTYRRVYAAPGMSKLLRVAPKLRTRKAQVWHNRPEGFAVAVVAGFVVWVATR